MNRQGRSDLVYAKVAKLTWNKKVVIKITALKIMQKNC